MDLMHSPYGLALIGTLNPSKEGVRRNRKLSEILVKGG